MEKKKRIQIVVGVNQRDKDRLKVLSKYLELNCATIIKQLIKIKYEELEGAINEKNNTKMIQEVCSDEKKI